MACNNLEDRLLNISYAVDSSDEIKATATLVCFSLPQEVIVNFGMSESVDSEVLEAIQRLRNLIKKRMTRYICCAE